jgi:23S rRNA pseudouridine1911/1915/1917 synthase
MILNQGWTYQEQVQAKDENLTVLDYYTKYYPHSTQEEWLTRILAGQICLNHQKVSPNTYLKKGQQLTYHRPPWQEPDVPLKFDIIYEDEDLIVINKPSGLPVLPAGNFLENTLLWQLKKLYPHEKVVPIHRLGRGTSGLILIGRSSQGRSVLTQQMREQKITKIYHALIGKSDLPDYFTIDQPIGKVAYPSLGYLYAATSQGKFAYSEGWVLERQEKTTLLAVKILTGRPHQIRIHLASIGYPLLGDPLYIIGGIPKIHDNNKLAVPGDCGYFLHAYQLSFLHPQTQENLNFIYPSPISLTK